MRRSDLVQHKEKERGAVTRTSQIVFGERQHLLRVLDSLEGRNGHLGLRGARAGQPSDHRSRTDQVLPGRPQAPVGPALAGADEMGGTPGLPRSVGSVEKLAHARLCRPSLAVHGVHDHRGGAQDSLASRRHAESAGHLD